MAVKVPIDEDSVRDWAEISHGARLLQHCLRNCGDPKPGSAFAQVADLYPYERVSDRAGAFLEAAVEHLIFWAEVQTPLKFHPDHTVEVTLRPSYTLARASLESAAQAVWLMDTTDPMECIRRHIRLMRWDLHELRKSRLDPAEKAEAKKIEEDLLHRVSPVFTDEQVRPPQGYLEIIRLACAADGLALQPDDAERIWRAASGVAHGKYWPVQELQKVVGIEDGVTGTGPDDGTGLGASVRVPDVDGITEVLRTAHQITQIGVLRFLDYSGADIAALLVSARDHLNAVIPIKEGSSREDLRRLFSEFHPEAGE